jgi:hypothetical protein
MKQFHKENNYNTFFFQFYSPLASLYPHWVVIIVVSLILADDDDVVFLSYISTLVQIPRYTTLDFYFIFCLIDLEKNIFEKNKILVVYQEKQNKTSTSIIY